MQGRPDWRVVWYSNMRDYVYYRAVAKPYYVTYVRFPRASYVATGRGTGYVTTYVVGIDNL